MAADRDVGRAWCPAWVWFLGCSFADWLRGYGMLLVIDHGDGFMTLYGHNESLLHEAGEWVNGGDVISTVGSNPGGTQGAYFEIRRDGKALDPSAWLAR